MNAGIHSNHFEPDKIYSYRPVSDIPLGAEVLVVTKWDDAFKGILIYVGERKVVGGSTPYFSIQLIPEGHQNGYDISTTQVYQVTTKALLEDILKPLTDL